MRNGLKLFLVKDTMHDNTITSLSVMKKYRDKFKQHYPESNVKLSIGDIKIESYDIVHRRKSKSIETDIKSLCIYNCGSDYYNDLDLQMYKDLEILDISESYTELHYSKCNIRLPFRLKKIIYNDTIFYPNV